MPAGIVKAAGEGLGIQSLCLDLGFQFEVGIEADSSAAIGICQRAGLGKVRHLAVAQLWVQERLRSKDFALTKVLGTENPADVLTKAVNRMVMEAHAPRMNLTKWSGRAEIAPQLI